MASRPATLLLALLVFPRAASARDLKAFFQERCAVCHGADGSGRGQGGAPLGGRNLAEARWLVKQADDELAAAILRGRGAMPGFRRQLSEAEARRMVADVIRPLSVKKRP